MATENVSDAQQSLAREAIIEIWSLANVLGREKDNEGFDELLRGSLIRIRNLSSVILSITGGDSRETSEMHEVIFGEPITAA